MLASIQVMWSTCVVLQVPAPFKPRVKGPGDASNFDPYDEEPLNAAPTELFPREFADF